MSIFSCEELISWKNHHHSQNVLSVFLSPSRSGSHIPNLWGFCFIEKMSSAFYFVSCKVNFFNRFLRIFSYSLHYIVVLFCHCGAECKFKNIPQLKRHNYNMERNTSTNQTFPQVEIHYYYVILELGVATKCNHQL